MSCYGGTRIERGPFGTVVLQRHVGCCGDDVMAGGWCRVITVCLTAADRKACRSRDERRRLIEMKFAMEDGAMG